MPTLAMTATSAVEELVQSDYEHGFVTDIESDTLPPGLAGVEQVYSFCIG